MSLALAFPGSPISARPRAQGELTLHPEGRWREQSATLGRHESHRYRLALSGSQGASGPVDLVAELEQAGADLVLVLACRAPAVERRFDSPTGRSGLERFRVPLFARIEARCEVGVEGLEGGAPNTYRLRLALLPSDGPRASAERASSAASEAFAAAAEARGTAIAAAEEAREAWLRLGDPLEEGRAGHRLAVLHRQAGDLDLALHALEAARPRLMAAASPADLARLLNELGHLHTLRGEPALAREPLEAALAHRRVLGDLHGEVQTLNNLGLALLETAGPRVARPSFEAALGHLARLEQGGQGDPALEAAVQHNLGGLALREGRAAEARERFEVVRRRHAIGGRPVEAAQAGVALAAAQRALGAYGAARRSLVSARLVFERAGEERLLATALNNEGLLDLAVGEAASALDRFRELLGLRRRLGDRRGEATTLQNLGQAASELGRVDEARDAFQAALALRRALGDRRGEAITLEHLGRLETRQGAFAAAERALAAALGIRQQLGAHQEQGRALAALGELALARGDRQTAEPAFGRALEAAGEDAEGAIAALVGRAAVSRGRGDLDAAAADLALAMDRLEALRRQVDLGDRAAYLARRWKVPESFLGVLAERAEQRPGRGQARELFAAIERTRVRSLLERIQAVDAGGREAATLDAPELESLLDPETTLLVLALAEPRSHLLRLSLGALELRALPGRAELEGAARRFATAIGRLDRGDGAEEWRAGASLAAMLFGREGALAGTPRLALAFEGALETVPWAALPVPGEVGTLLLDRHELVQLPSGTVLAALRERERKREPARQRLLLLADPTFGSGLPRLTSSRREVERIAALFPAAEARVVTGAAASLPFLRSGALSSFRWLHLATHARVDPEDPERSALALATSPRGPEVWWRADEIERLDLRSELVVLASCRSAAGRTTAAKASVGCAARSSRLGSRASWRASARSRTVRPPS